MNKKNPITALFFVFFIAALAIFIFGLVGALKPFESLLQFIFSPVQQAVYSVSFPFNSSSQTAVIQEENKKLLKQLLDQKKLQKENAALKDQFQTETIVSQTLLAARIIGAPGFVPGISLPQYYILDKGSEQGVRKGQAVVYKDFLVGVIERVSSSRSKVALITGAGVSLTAKTLASTVTSATQSANGIAKGQGAAVILLENVLVSDSLKKGEFAVTKGSVDEKGNGVMADIIIGKIISVDKKPSALFQSAQIESPLDFNKLETVFIITGTQQ